MDRPETASNRFQVCVKIQFPWEGLPVHPKLLWVVLIPFADDGDDAVSAVQSAADRNVADPSVADRSVVDPNVVDPSVVDRSVADPNVAVDDFVSAVLVFEICVYVLSEFA